MIVASTMCALVSALVVVCGGGVLRFAIISRLPLIGKNERNGHQKQETDG
jgi:hypothetical protein